MTDPTPHPAALSFADLQRLSGYLRPADVENWCRANGVPYFPAKGRGVCTTLDALNKALRIQGVDPSQPAVHRVEF